MADRTKGRKVLAGSAAVLTLSAVGNAVSPGVASAEPVCGLVPNKYGQQAAHKGYKGQYGRLETRSPYVGNYTQAFSLSHLYSFYQPSGGSYFVEVGWYKGYGTEINAYPYSRYYTAKRDSRLGYTEHNFGQVGAEGSIKQYEVQYEDYRPQYEDFVWRVYAGTLTTPLYTWYPKEMATAVPTSGAEVSGNASAGSDAFSHIDSQQLKINNNVYSNWNSTLMSQQGDYTSACDDASIAFDWVSLYREHTVGGGV